MNLLKLIEMQTAGVMNTSVNEATGEVKVGGMVVSREQCDGLAQTLGWIKYDKEPWEVIEKENRFIRGIKAHIDNDQILQFTDVTFQNTRRMNSMKFIDRIKFVNPQFDITVIYAAVDYGKGGAYDVYSSSNNFNYPVYNCRTAKQLGTYINNLLNPEE